jgi:hypothetical protein
MNRLEEKIKAGYEEYLKLPLAEMNGKNRDAELYNNGWCIFTGRAIMHPDPHRHYTLIEFAYTCGKNESLYDRFITSQ